MNTFFKKYPSQKWDKKCHNPDNEQKMKLTIFCQITIRLYKMLQFSINSIVAVTDWLEQDSVPVQNLEDRNYNRTAIDTLNLYKELFQSALQVKLTDTTNPNLLSLL